MQDLYALISFVAPFKEISGEKASGQFGKSVSLIRNELGIRTGDRHGQFLYSDVLKYSDGSVYIRKPACFTQHMAKLGLPERKLLRRLCFIRLELVDAYLSDEVAYSLTEMRNDSICMSGNYASRNGSAEEFGACLLIQSDVIDRSLMDDCTREASQALPNYTINVELKTEISKLSRPHAFSGFITLGSIPLSNLSRVEIDLLANESAYELEYSEKDIAVAAGACAPKPLGHVAYIEVD